MSLRKYNSDENIDLNADFDQNDLRMNPDPSSMTLDRVLAAWLSLLVCEYR